MANQDYLFHARVEQLGKGRPILIRLLNQGDREGFAELVREASPEDALFLKQDFRDRQTRDNWFDRLNYRQILPLVAVDLERHIFAAVAIMDRGEHAHQHLGEIRILVAEPYRRLGLGSLLLGDLIDLAGKEDLFWLSAMVPWAQRQVVSAYEAKGFEIKSRLPDFFCHPNGLTHDVVLMMRPMQKRQMEF